MRRHRAMGCVRTGWRPRMTSHAPGRSALIGLFLAALAVERPGHAIRAADQSTGGGSADLVDRTAFLAPPMDVRPAIRWWWPGGDVDDRELGRELGVIRDAGFGSVEIQSCAVGLPDNAPAAVHTYGTPPWFDHVATVLDQAATLGLKVDLTLGSSWPSGGVHVQDDQSL